LRRRYQEFDDNASTNGDDYFSGVAPRRKHKDQAADVEMGGVPRLDLSDVEDSDEEGSVDSEAEKKMWRDGFGKKVVVHEVVAATGSPIKPREAILKDAKGLTTTTTTTPTTPTKEDAESDHQTVTRRSSSPAEGDGFATPLEVPYEPTPNIMEFQTSMEHPAARQSTHAEIFGRLV
jgi:hypothetical protein